MGRSGAARVAERVQTARSVELAGAVDSVPLARHLVRDDLRGRGLPPGVVDNALAVVTELVSNAVLHAKPLQFGNAEAGVLLQWKVRADHVEVDVVDGGGVELPQVRRPAPAETAGRGLAIVDAMARDWTVDVEPGRVTVHAIVGPLDDAS